jgi:aspartate dehydrogenase
MSASPIRRVNGARSGSIRVGLLGLGTIGRAVARALVGGLPGVVLAGAMSRDAARARGFLATLPGPPPLLELDRLVAESDLVVEAATQAALVEVAPRILDAGRDLLVLSVGALLEHPEWVDGARARGARIHAPSAAIAGLDGLKGAAVQGHLETVTMETRKPPGGLRGAPGVAHVDLAAVTGPTVVFEGTAREACRAFPANVNVVAAVSLAGLGPDRTRISIVADPGIDRNCHVVTAEGAFGRLRIELENVPSENPRTGKLAYLSTIAYLRDLRAPLRIGT